MPLYSSTQASTSIILLVASTFDGNGPLVVSISLIFALTRPPRALLPRGSRSTSARTLPLKDKAAP